jgi:natural product biosynthesis luciferase-like monooxygenase protein/amino acid adenylation domain-containing protein
MLQELRTLFGELAGQDLSAAPADASFFDLGFDSLFLTQASQALRKRFGVKITFRQLLEDLTTLDTMAGYLAEKAPAAISPAPAPAKAAPVAAPASPAPATTPAEPVSPIAVSPSTSSGTVNPLLEEIIRGQQRILEQQLALLRGAPAPAPGASLPIAAQPIISAPPAPQPTPVAAAPEAKPEAKPFGPYRPIEKGAGAGFTDQQQRHLDNLIERYLRKTPESRRRTQETRRQFSDPRSVSGFRPFWKEMVYPIITVRSAGARFWDVDGHEYIDITMGFGTNLLGHAPEFITQALQEQLKSGIEVGPQSPIAGEVAQLLCELTGHERAAFCNTGSEAVLAAVRLARTVTGRSRIATTSGFHGINDEVLVRANIVNGQRRSVPVAPGIPEHVVRDVLVLDYGTDESLDLLQQHADDLAAILIEPVQSRHPDLQPRAFLQEVRRITSRSETALIFDEVINGFRCHLHGAQAHFGVKSDIGTWGKIIGGGMPIGAVTGSAQFMDALDGGYWQFGDTSFPEVGVTFFAGTYVRHPLAMAASRAMLRYLKEQGPGLQQRLNERTTAFVTRLNSFLRAQGVPLHIEHFSSLFYFHFEPEVKFGSLLYFHLREKGLHIWEGRPCFLSTAHTDEDVEEIIRIFRESILEMQRGGFLPEPPVGAEIIEIRPPQPRIVPLTPTPAPLLAPAAVKPMQFSLYFFGQYPAEFRRDKYDLILDSARFADAYGFTAIWIPERHFHAHGGFSPNPSVLAAALARETKQLQLRGGSVVLPLHHPVRVAEEWAVVDNLSQGRTGIAIGSGWHPNDFVFAPTAFDQRRELCHQYLHAIQRLWRGETISFPTGGQNELEVKLHPMPKQAELPVWLTCIHKESFIKAGELGVGVLGYLMNQTIDEAAEKIALYRDALARHGHDPAKGHVTLLLHTLIGPDLESTRAMARGPLRDYIRTFLDNSHQKRSETQGDEVEMEADDVEFLVDRAFEDYANGKALIGSVESCAEVVARLQSIGVDEIGCFVDFGVSAETALVHLRYIADLQAQCASAPTPAASRALDLYEAQRGLWAIGQFGQEAARAYNEGTTLELTGPLDVSALRTALQQLVDRHEGLRTTFQPDGEKLLIHPHCAFEVTVEDFSELAETERAGQLRARFAEFEQQVFDFTQGPILRALVLKLAPDRYLLSLLFHHLLGNGPSYWIFFEELTALYDAARHGRPAALERPLQFSDYLRWRAARTGTGDDQADEAFWREQFAGELPVLELPADHPRPAFRTFRGGRQTLHLDESLTRHLRETGARYRSSLFMLLFAAYKTWLYRLSNQRDVIVGVPYESNVRDLPGGAHLFANTTNMLPLRTQLDPEMPFSDLLAATKSQILAANDHQEYFFGSLLPKLGVKLDPSRPPLFSVTFNYETGKFVKDAGGVHFSFVSDEVPYRNARDISPFELVMNIAEKDGALRIECDFNADLFAPETVGRWLGLYQTLLESIVSQPTGPLAQLPLLDETQRRQVLSEPNQTDLPIPAGAVHEWIAAQVGRTPHAVAVECEDRQLDYAQLDREATELAGHLQQLGAAPGKLLGVCVERSIEMLVAVLGVLKTGAAYVPLDPAFPAARLALMIEDAALPVIVTTTDLIPLLPETAAQMVSLHSLPARPASFQPVTVAPEDRAYVIFTSGSTGRPKGVEIPHRALANFLESMRHRPGFTSTDRLLAVTTLSFDIAGLELFLPLITGGAVIIATQETAVDPIRLSAELTRSRATVMQATPATWRALLSTGWNGAPGLKVLVGGEAVPADLVAELLPRVQQVWNMYGPTETTIWSTIEPLTSAATPIVIGRPIANTQSYVLNSSLQPQPAGVAGELHLGGLGLARGYLHQPELTAQKFIADPFSGISGARLYKTGDLARFLPDGRIECLGRLDQQLKVRGFRIERGEIEAVFRAHPEVRDVAVTVRASSSGDERLLAFYTLRNGHPVDELEIRRHLEKHLPVYMLPSVLIPLDALPLTPNGKVDYKALPEIVQSALAPREIVPAETATQKGLVALWEELLDRRPIGIRDSFFDLGGHSLLAIRMISRVARQWHVNLPLRGLFEAPTIADVATAIETAPQSSGTAAEATPIPVARRLRREASRTLDPRPTT